ncbi:zinc-dependent alcohol dehydrogenase family protein [Gimesia chilikensis]|uniref:zinc-dependent alcohol dehydrogenase family protein n=1 Tax=Gimesia chilikensis TaxID=2605989 RepID=UPI001189FBC1|nr:zinc-dependent alcohol dehydrogenase family protein [Gimesia chilikensis]QDT84423.1 Putative alcohol dehydrogenase D [Gimesia chilikensis]
MHTRAAVLYEMEKPTPYAESKPLVIEELHLDDPGPGEVLVKLAGASLCHSDLSTIDGSRPRVMPMVMGHEASGIVREVGPGVHDLQPDDHVVFSFVPLCGHCIPCATGRPALCEPGAKANTAGTLLSGHRPLNNAAGEEIYHHLGVAAFSEYTVVAQESLIKIDSQLPLSTAALFGCAVMTGVGAVVNTAKVEPGSSVAVFGLGGVGLSTIMGARAAGAESIFAVDLLPEKLELAAQVGATHLINAGEEDPVMLLKDLMQGVDYTFESVGNEQVLQQAYAATKRGGTTVTIGLPHPARMFSIPAVSLVAEERTIKGSYMGSAVPRRDLPRFIAMYQAGLLPVDKLLSRTIQLDEINSAFDDLATGAAVRQVITFEK